MSSDQSTNDFKTVGKNGTMNMNEVQSVLPVDLELKNTEIRVCYPIQVRSLPEDLTIEILSWLPVKPIVRCKCVCKSWQSIIQDTKFIRMHMLRLKLTPIIFENGSTCENSSFKYIHDIDGLHLEFSDNPKIYRIRNNATNQVLILPDPEMNRYSMTMGYVPSTNEYKVQYLYWKGITGGIGMKLLTIGHQNIWRSIEIPFSNFLKVITMKTFDGVSYIVYKCSLPKVKMLGFQFEDESFMEILTPEGMPKVTNVTNLKFVIWDKKISFGCLVKKTFYVWILVDLKKSKWEERKIVFPPNFLVQHHDIFEEFDPCIVDGCWLYLFRDNRKKWLPYNIETKQATKVTNLCVVRDSIVRVEGMQ